MKIVFLDSHTLSPGDIDLKPLHELGALEIYDRTKSSDIYERTKNADVIITNKVQIKEDILKQLPQLKMIQVAATGYNSVDVVAAKKQNITVCNVSGYSTSSVVQHVMSNILSYRNTPQQYFDESRKGVWSQNLDFSYWHKSIQELSGQTFGVLGFGKIGRQVAHVAKAFGMQVIAVNKYPEKYPMENVEFVDIETIFKKSDILSLHVPLNPTTKYIVNSKNLSLMKSSALLINTGRGDLIKETELKIALESNTIEAAFLDVLSQEPPPSDHVLLGVKNCYITPHQAWASLQSRERLLNGIVENIKAFEKGTPVNVVS